MTGSTQIGDQSADSDQSYHNPRDLTQFQHDVLLALARTPGFEDYGLGIKFTLEDEYQEEVNRGRLYPSLNGLVESGLVDRGSIDDRTNNYRLTDDGKRLVIHEYRRRRVAANNIQSNGGELA